MAQIFKPKHNTFAKLIVMAIIATPWILIYAGSTISRSPANTLVGVPQDQPVPFSHRHHAWELGIDCRYCHTSVEKSSYAGIPSTETCMSCHSQIWTNSPLLDPVRKSYETNTPIKWESDGSMGWTLLNKIPEFVYFDHSIHIARGVSCNNCHGPVQKMQITWKGQPLQMVWCLACHREPQKFLYKDPQFPNLTPSQQVFNLYAKLQRDPDMKSMTPKELGLLKGETEPNDARGIQEGKALVEQLGVKTKQLADCSICHR